MSDVPPEVGYGKVVGRFVSYIADTTDQDDVPNEIPLTGTVTLTPLTVITRWPTTVPPRQAINQQVVAQVIDGDLCGPQGTPGVWVLATDQPSGQPNLVQWRASFKLTNVLRQPEDVTFNVPTNGSVDLAMVFGVDAQLPVVTVVSHEDATNAAASADDAAASVVTAQASATAAQNSATAASTSATNAANSATGAGTSATDAAASATSATASKNAAATSATNAQNSATTAAGSVTAAQNSASAASTSATNAANSATGAGTSATNAANSATGAGTSATNAANSASAAATSASSVPKWWQGTQAQYDAIPVKDPQTLYVITP
jgi:hypothetical protein